MPGTTPAYLADKIAKHIAALATYTPPATVYAALVVSDSSDATPGTECSDANYTSANAGRIPITLANLFSDASGVLTTILDILWPAAAVSYVVHGVEFVDTATISGTAFSGANRVLPFIPVSPNVTVPINEQFKLPAGSGTETVS